MTNLAACKDCLGPLSRLLPPLVRLMSSRRDDLVLVRRVLSALTITCEHDTADRVALMAFAPAVIAALRVQGDCIKVGG